MEISILLAQQIAQLFLMIFMGFLIVKAGLLKDEDSKVLSKIVLYLIIPCVILNAFQVDYTPETVRGLLVAFAASLLMQVVLLFAVSALGRVFHLDAVEITSVYYSNSGNLIVPLVTAILGEEWVLYSCVYMSVQLVFFWTHCKKVISREASYDWKKIVLNLNIISIFVGILLFFTGIRLPALVNNTLHSVGSMVGPASMIVTGMLFAGMDFRQIFANKRIYFVTFLRLIAVPLMALVLLKISHLADLSADGPTLILIVFLAVITPSASTVTQMCQVYGNDSRYASAINVVTTLASIVTMPLLVMLVAALIGNILGYTALKDFAASMYYGSYSLPTYVTIWSADAFVKTTVIPLILMFLMNLFVLMNKLSLSPLKFIRRDLKRHQKKKAFRLNSKIGILKRFRIRVIFQNLPNYITIVIGILFANFILMFGFMFEPMLDHFQDQITSNMIADYQYLLKAPQETENEEAEKYSATSLKTLEENGKKSEEVSVYGIQSDSAYLDLDWKTKDDGVIISTAYANKLNVEEGDTITIKESYGDKEYTFHVDGVYDYPAAIAIFMPQEQFNKTFDFDADSFNGYFSNTEITDIDDLYVATVITVDDMTKTSRQLKVSMGNMMAIFYVFGIIMFMLIVYLLSKIIIEKNAQSISMTKILGYSRGEINGLYVLPTSIIVIASMILTIPICHYIMKYVCIQVFADYPGWLEYYVPFYVFVKMVILGICGYAVIAFLQNRKVKKVPLGEALKNAE